MRLESSFFYVIKRLLLYHIYWFCSLFEEFGRCYNLSMVTEELDTIWGTKDENTKKIMAFSLDVIAGDDIPDHLQLYSNGRNCDGISGL